MTAGRGQPVFAELVKELLAAEEQRRTSLESRGMAVLTISGTLVTLLLGLAALVTRQDSFMLADVARGRLGAAVVTFVIAALFAIATYTPQSMRIIDPADLARQLPNLWDLEKDFALKKATATRLDLLKTTQHANNLKGYALLGAVVMQVIAVGLLAWAVIDIL